MYGIQALMYIMAVPNCNSPPAILLRESFRHGNKSRTRTLATLTSWAPERIDALRRVLKGEFDGFTEDLNVQFPSHTGDVILRCVEAEADEMHSFVQKKTHEQWRWLAMDRE